MAYESFNNDPSMRHSARNYGARRLGVFAACLTAGAGLATGAVLLNHTTELHEPQLVTVDRVDSDGNKLSSYDAAVEDIANAAFEQLDEAGITDPEARQKVADSIDDAAEAATTSEYDGSLVGDTVEVKIVKDVWNNPKVAVVRHK